MSSIVAYPPVSVFKRAPVLRQLGSEEVLSSLRVLLQFARAGGRFSSEERQVVRESLHAVSLPDGVDTDELLDTEIDLEAHLRKIACADARERTYNAAYSLIHAHEPCTAESEALLERIRAGLQIDPQRARLMSRMFADARDWMVSGLITPIDDPARREAAVHDHTLKLSIVSALTGAVSAPALSVFADVLVLAIQVKLVCDIGRYWGQHVGREAARRLVTCILGATGIRIAVHSLVSIIPILGSAAGAASSFMSTWALGKVARQYFARNGDLSTQDLRTLYRQARQDAQFAYENSKHAVRSGA